MTKQKASEKKRPANIFDGKIYCGTCGRRFGRSISDTKDGGHIYWHCRAKSNHGITCDSVNYDDSEIRDIFCRIMKKNVFDEDYFLNTVERIIVYKTGTIDFNLENGNVKQFKTFKLRKNVHETTSTDEFTNKIICASCGNTYHRYCCGGKYVYWHCSGKSKVKTECCAHDIADFNLRRISAYIMDCEEFDGEEFIKAIDHITALEDGSLEYTFKDGRTETWERM